MRTWKVRLLALLTAVAMLLAVSGSAAMADDDGWDDDGGDDYGWYGYYSWYYYPYYYYGDDDWGDD